MSVFIGDRCQEVVSTAIITPQHRAYQMSHLLSPNWEEIGKQLHKVNVVLYNECKIVQLTKVWSPVNLFLQVEAEINLGFCFR